MTYVVLYNIDDPETRDSGTGWGIFEADSPEEAVAKSGHGDDDFIVVQNGGSWGRHPSAVRPVTLSDSGLGYVDGWEDRL